MPAKSRKPPEPLENPSLGLQVVAANLARLTKGKSQSAVGQLTKVDQRAIGRILNMENEPTLEKVTKVAAAFKLAPWQLLTPELQPGEVPRLTTEKLPTKTPEAVILALAQFLEAMDGADRGMAESLLSDLTKNPTGGVVLAEKFARLAQAYV